MSAHLAEYWHKLTAEGTPGPQQFDLGALITGGAIATVLAALIAGFFGWRRAKAGRQEALEDARSSDRAEAVAQFLDATLVLQSAATQLLADASVGYEGMSIPEMKQASQSVVDGWQAFQAKAESVRSKLAGGSDGLVDLADSLNGPVEATLRAATPGSIDRGMLRASSTELAAKLLDVRHRVVTLQEERGGKR